MEAFDERLRQMLEGYANFLRKWELALPKHQPYLVRWVRDFLLFARDACRVHLRADAGPVSGRSGRAGGHEAVAASAGVGRDTHLPLSVPWSQGRGRRLADGSGAS